MKKSIKLAFACSLISLISLISSAVMFGVNANNDTVEIPSDGMEVSSRRYSKKGDSNYRRKQG